MHELSKSIQRRLHDASFVTRYFVGAGIDIGAGNDSLAQYRELFPFISSVRAWDVNDGDAQAMETCTDAQFDFVHSSHCLEHMKDPEIALKNWFRVLKPGGHLIVIVPDEDMYEQGVFPSTYNPDHKWTFTVFKRSSWSSNSRNVMELSMALGEEADIVKLEQLVSTYRYGLRRLDQTQTPIGEAAIELVVRRRPRSEVAAGGCLGPERERRITGRRQ
jgi:SAM-dependent methyltransferase